MKNSLISVAEHRSPINSTIIHGDILILELETAMMSDSRWNLNVKYVEAYEKEHNNTILILSTCVHGGKNYQIMLQ